MMTYKLNPEGTWAIIDSEGNVIEEFRSKSTALFWVQKLKKNYF